MKKYFNTFAKTFFFTAILLMLFAVLVKARSGFTMAYVRLTIGALLMSIFIALAITIFRSEKGKGYINAILGYIIVIPALFVFRNIFGTYLFTRAWIIFIVIGIVGIIYGIALLVASKKYKTEVDELNRLLLDKEDNQEED
ncbi:hypothetical protein ACAG96_01665 [Candidatus Izemoplasma sp. B36]|uniref:hypothetical protein n=1 Tax=Candidatus Izemoplasma sp. B36 TaxID=3242468 RepID=UPI003558E314